MGRRLSLLSCLVVVIGAVLAPTVAAGRAAPSSAMVTLEVGVLKQLNSIRATHGLAPLKLSAPLSTAANKHASDMASRGYFAHDSADGSPFWKRVQRFYAAKNFAQWSVGENLLWASSDLTPKRALELWMASPAHRKNILTASWREIGISAIHADAAPGTFGGRPVTVITTDFGVRR